jgi:hypothetical protein
VNGNNTTTRTNLEKKGKPMLKSDRSLRIAVWIIAVFLGVIALRPLVGLEAAQAESAFEKLRSAGEGKQKSTAPSSEQQGSTAASGKIVPFASQGGGVFWAYDRETMGIYVYNTVDGRGYYLGKISQLGKPMDQAGVRDIPFLR